MIVDFENMTKIWDHLMS